MAVPTPGTPTAQASAAADATLVLAARRGDRDAFARLYQRYAPIIHGVLLAAGVDGEAEDLTQEVFVNAIRALNSLRDPAAFGGWLVMSARNRASSFIRSRAAAPPVRLVRDVQAPPPVTSEGLTADEVMNAVRELPEAYRETLVLRLVEGLSGPEISQRTGLTHGSVRVNLHRGMDLLRARLAEGAR